MTQTSSVAAEPVTSMTDNSASESRRRFLNRATGVAVMGGAFLAACSEGIDSPLADTPTPTATSTPTPTPTIQAVTDTDQIVMLAQLHYLQAEFYSRAVLGEPLSSTLVSGSGTLGDVTGARRVTFTDVPLADGLREIAIEKIDQVVRLRAVLGSAMPARPALDLGVGEANPFGQYSSRAAVVTGTTRVPADVYANQDNLLLGAFILEDAVASAWRGSAPLMMSAASIELAAGLLAASSFHTGFIRLQTFLRGAANSNLLRISSWRLSDLRDSFSSTVDDDKGVTGGNSNGTSLVLGTADIALTDGEGEIYGRLPNLTLNTFFMTRASATSGGFFPAGVNGVIRSSTAN